MNAPSLFSRLHNERDAFEALLNQVGFTRRMTMNGLEGGLSVKDLLADIFCREQFISDRLNEILLGEKYAPCVSHSALEAFRQNYGFPDYESSLCNKTNIDHLVVHRHKNIALDEIVTQEIEAYGSILSALEKITDSQYLDHDVHRRVAEHTYRPYQKAGAEIRRWLKSIASESK